MNDIDELIERWENLGLPNEYHPHPLTEIVDTTIIALQEMQQENTKWEKVIKQIQDIASKRIAELENELASCKRSNKAMLEMTDDDHAICKHLETENKRLKRGWIEDSRQDKQRITELEAENKRMRKWFNHSEIVKENKRLDAALAEIASTCMGSDWGTAGPEYLQDIARKARAGE